MKCFISYTQADLSWAEWVAWHFEENGYRTILQAWDFRAGCNFVLEPIVCLRDAAYTHPEWASALARATNVLCCRSASRSAR